VDVAGAIMDLLEAQARVAPVAVAPRRKPLIT
jgi:hypothetical protein